MTTYNRTARSLHWLTALLITGVLGLGLYMADLPLSPQKLQYYAWHKWAGVTVFFLTVLRLGWRLVHPAPPLPADMPALARRAAQAGHLALYVLMLVIPLTGWLMSSAKGFQTVWFGVLPLPDLVGRDRALGDALRDVHEWLNWALMLMLAGHVGAALFHHFVKRDDTLARMVGARTARA